MRNLDIYVMRPGVLETNTLIDKKSPTDTNGLDSFMDISGLVLRGSLVAFPYIQAVHMGKVQSSKLFGSTPFLSMA